MRLEMEKIGGARVWVARITGTDPKFGLKREFVNGIVDKTRANSCGSRGVHVVYNLPDGIYEVQGGQSWAARERRRFVRVAGDEMEEIGLSDVLASLGEVGAAN